MRIRTSSFLLCPLYFLCPLFTLFLLVGCPGEDITPPEVTISAPADGDTIAGPTTIRASATDDRGVTSVEFFVDGVRIGIDSTPAGNVFECAWLGLMRPGSADSLRCTATDAAGNRSSSPAITVYISSTAGTHHSGTIDAPQTWTADASPHVIDSDLFVEAILTLRPGVVVLVADGATIAVGTRSPAGIVARGRADSMITFSALNSTPGPGAWNGIVFRTHTAQDGSQLRHCVVEYAGSGGSLVRCEAGRVDVDSSRFRSSSGSGVSASGNGLGSLSHSAFSTCWYPVSITPGLVSALGTGNAFSQNHRNAVEVPGGTVTATDTWPGLGFPYAITSTLTVADSTNPLLFLASGCSLLFADSARLRVGLGKPGALRADGTYGRVVFGPLADAPGSGQWRGIEFWEQTDPIRTILNYCNVERAGAGNTAAVTCYAEVLIANTKITGSAGFGIYCQNTGFARFENDTITGCGGFPLHIAAPYVGTIGDGNSFTGNVQDAIEVPGGTITDYHTQVRRQDVPYRVLETIEIGSALEPTLIIESGAELQFGPGAALAVGRNGKATLQADSVTLTGATAQPGAWSGLELHRYTTNASRVERCRLLYGGGGTHGILYIDSCLPTITGNEVAWSSNWCIYLVDRDTILEPDTLRHYNSLHDWAPGDTDIIVGFRRR
jgi:hypothetical protein